MITEFDARLWVWDPERRDSWMFATLPEDLAEDIRALAGPRRGFGSSRVRVGIGATRWSTSVFPDRTRGYLLPVKRAVRRAEGLRPGDVATVSLELLEL
ncbi:hypothetical protein FHU38_001885 [Saccharomonospora amisosensis]|uniref:DUF1905 domain-containing protein n=1 Tax=Saccharomonospora amisosensis TaxID=1128677 RepID=A0A7X5UP01_9PSEU|nr:DUF1905 domain-containing protein [Saccharomonospora amisosensis]NIJ11541.1 hypothetical protein [Saccharomonospora amisosensis]